MTVTQVDKIVRLTFDFNQEGGAVGQDVIEAGCTYRATAVPTDGADIDATLLDMATAANAALVANVAQSWYGSQLVLTKIRAALEGTNGHTLFEQFSVATGALAWRGSSSSQALPWQTAWVLSIYGYQPGTFTPLGKHLRGRMYLPAPASGSLRSNTGEMSDSDTSDMTHQWGTVLAQVQGHTYSLFPTFGPVLGINSRSTSTFAPCTWLRSDTKIDTQRRRANRETGDVGIAAYPSSF